MPLLEQLSALPDYYDTLRLKVKKKKHTHSKPQHQLHKWKATTGTVRSPLT